MAWEEPKIDWTSSDGIQDADFNRIEGNTRFLYDQIAENRRRLLISGHLGSSYIQNDASDTFQYQTIYLEPGDSVYLIRATFAIAGSNTPTDATISISVGGETPWESSDNVGDASHETLLYGPAVFSTVHLVDVKINRPVSGLPGNYWQIYGWTSWVFDLLVVPST